MININYIGNKRKLSDWIMECIPKDVKTVVDAFAGSTAVSKALKQNKYNLVTNDVLFSSYVMLKGLIENNKTKLNKINNINEVTIDNKFYKECEPLKNTLYYEKEVVELEKILTWIDQNLNGYEYYLALSLVRRAMIRKIPYSRLNVPWSYITKLRDEDYSYKLYGRRRAYHNKSFLTHINNDMKDFNNMLLETNSTVKAENLDIIDLLNKYPKQDLLYLDPPYPSTMNNYDSYYGKFDEIFNQKKPHVNLTNKSTFVDNMRKILNKAKGYKYILISYNNKVVKTLPDLEEMFKEFGSVEIYEHKHNYQLTSKKTKNSNVEKLALIRVKEVN